jgi:hypothetical protein
MLLEKKMLRQNTSTITSFNGGRFLEISVAFSLYTHSIN